MTRQLIRRVVPGLLPRFRSLDVWIPATATDVEKWIEFVGLRSATGEVAVGFDAEWRPSFSSDRNKIALVQVSTEESAMLLQLHHIPDVSHPLGSIMKSPIITKVGVGVLDDLKAVEEDYGIAFDNFLDVGVMLRRHMPGIRSGLVGLFNSCYHTTHSKSKLQQMSNWENYALSPDQVEYAAQDAVMASHIYAYIQKKGWLHDSYVTQGLRDLLTAITEGDQVTLARHYTRATESTLFMTVFKQYVHQDNYEGMYKIHGSWKQALETFVTNYFDCNVDIYRDRIDLSSAQVIVSIMNRELASVVCSHVDIVPAVEQCCKQAMQLMHATKLAEPNIDKLLPFLCGKTKELPRVYESLLQQLPKVGQEKATKRAEEIEKKKNDEFKMRQKSVWLRR